MNWQFVKLSEVAPSKPLKVNDFNGEQDIWQLNLNHIESNTGKLLEREIKPFSKAGNSTHWFDERHVLYSKLRPYLNKVILPNQKGVGTTELVPMLPDNTYLIREYLAYYLRSKQFVDWISIQTAGAKMPRVSMKSFWEHEILLPPLPEQQKIAAILDAADTLRQKDQQLIEKYTALSQSLFLDMFGDPVKNPFNWESKTCGEYIDYLADIGSNGANKIVSEKLVMSDTEDYAVMIRTTNLNRNDFKNKIKYVSKEVYDFFKKSQVFGGEIIMNKIGSAGDFWLMPTLQKPVSLGLNQFLIRLKNINLLYFYHFLSTDYGTINIKSRCNGAATKSITKTAVRELPILYPPINLQNQFAERIQAIEAQKQQAQVSLQKSEDLFNSLLQRAFKGELTASKSANHDTA